MVRGSDSSPGPLQDVCRPVYQASSRASRCLDVDSKRSSVFPDVAADVEPRPVNSCFLFCLFCLWFLLRLVRLFSQNQNKSETTTGRIAMHAGPQTVQTGSTGCKTSYIQLVRGRSLHVDSHRPGSGSQTRLRITDPAQDHRTGSAMNISSGLWRLFLSQLRLNLPSWASPRRRVTPTLPPPPPSSPLCSGAKPQS